jgi:hypothetical protein
MSNKKREFKTSDEVYTNCINTHNTSILNKNLVTTHQSNAMRIAQKLSSTNLGGSHAVVNMSSVLPKNSYILKNKF